METYEKSNILNEKDLGLHSYLWNKILICIELYNTKYSYACGL